MIFVYFQNSSVDKQYVREDQFKIEKKICIDKK